MNTLITQSNYIPWKGYFDSIAKADVFIIYDDMQYTRRDWRNRNIIKAKTGLQWLTIPVNVKGKYLQKINETTIVGNNWQKEHLQLIKHNYAKALCFKNMIGWIENIYAKSFNLSLSATNILFLQEICNFLSINTTFINSKEFELIGNRTEKLLNICDKVGADTYITGPSAKNYIDENAFAEKGIEIEYVNYEGYKAYQQLFPPFEHHVSILDLIFNCGAEAKNYMKYSSSKQKNRNKSDLSN